MNGIVDENLPAYDVDAILAKAKACDAVSALIESLAARRNKKLIGREKHIYRPYQVHESILCDGINGTLLNYGLVLLAWSVEGMEAIGAEKRARILKQAIESFGDPERVRQLIRRFPVNIIAPEQKKLFDELDTRYYRVNENFNELVVAYVRQHIEEFRTYQTQNSPAQRVDAPNERR